jgi:glucose-1-phosphate adenylyltransferase
MELLVPEPPIDLYDPAWPIMTLPETLPPARLLFDSARQGSVANSLLAGGVVIRGAAVTNSVLSSNVRIGEGSTLDEAVVLPGARIGANCRLRRVIIDAETQVPDGTAAGAASHAGEELTVTLLTRNSFLSPPQAGADLRSVA